MSPQLVAAIVSATVSILIVTIGRLLFSRTDRRFPVLVLIQEKLLEMEANPPWDTNGGGLWFDNIVPKVAAPLDPYFDQLRMVSFPKRQCRVQKAWASFRQITEDSYKKEHPDRKESNMTKEELRFELRKVRESLAKG